MTYVIEGKANTVIRHKALIYRAPRPHPISSYGYLMKYRRTG